MSSGTSGARVRLPIVGRALETARVAEDRSDLDEVTLARARTGDRQAFRALVERYERPVFALLGRMLLRAGRESLVEDLAQETFVRVFRGLGKFGADGRNNLSAWILTIAARLAIDELRRRQPRVEPLRRGTRSPSRPTSRDRRARAIGGASPPPSSRPSAQLDARVSRRVPAARGPRHGLRANRRGAADRPRHRQVTAVARARGAATCTARNLR